MQINLEQMLAARDRRAEIQNKLLANAEPGACLVCLTLNIAGDVKRTPMTRMLFDRGLFEFDKAGLDVQEYIETDEPTGTEAFWLLDEDAEDVKRRLESIEEDKTIAASRLFDFDVLTYDRVVTQKLSRSESRKCLICDKPAAECSRSRAHGLDAIKAETDRLLKAFCSDTLAKAAYDSLIAELEATPKPGLVDLNNNGSHTDMDADTFRISANTLLPYFKDAALLGMNGCSMKELRARGIQADKEMFEATGGINTHQGMIYSMGLLLAGMGRSLTIGGDCIDNASSLAKEDAKQNFGATSHAISGFPDAVYCAERLALHSESNDINNAAVFAIIDSMARLEDTNLIRRGGRDGLNFAKKKAAETATLPKNNRMEAIYRFDEEMIERNLSPGGSADMLALAFLINKWNGISHNL